MSIRNFVIGLLVVCASNVQAQEKWTDNLKVSGNYHYGVALPEYPFLSYIVTDYVQSFDLCLIKESHGKNIWEGLYNFPEQGVSLFFSTLGNNAILGNELALTYFFKANFIHTKKFRLYNRMGFGVGYTNRRFDAQSNYLNVAVGSHFNIHFNARLGATYIWTEKLETNLGISFDHYSNANTAAPNLGINYTTLFAGMNYMIGNRLEKVKLERDKHKARFIPEFIFGIGGKKIRSFTFESKYFAMFSASAELHRDFFRGVHLGIGADVFYDTSIKTQFENSNVGYRPYMSWQTGLHVSQSFVYNRLSITIQEGFYIGLRNHIYQKLMYNRGIIKYRITDHFTLRLAMKSHLHILDYPEFGFGWRL